jgi:hypothetical protein
MEFSFRSGSRRYGYQRHFRLLCSCDRHNYGDLLFPIVTRRALMAIQGIRDQYRCHQYGMRRSDLSAFGALPSKGMSDLYHDAGDGDVVLLAGGENLAQTWFVMHLSLLGADAAKKLVFCREKLGPAFSERLSRWRFRGRQEFPYILSPDQFRGNVRVMYNSMGGWPLRHYSPADQMSIVRALAKASFISVREEESAAVLRELDAAVPVHVAPDCVFLLSDLLPKEELAGKASPRVRDLVRQTGEFLVFQCHPRYGDANREELKRQLLALAAQSGLNILLTPIGRIYSFNDDVFLESLGAEMGGSVRLLPASASIYDVAYVLASARLFCGTSLHGVISALTFGVPFVPLLSGDPKLRNNVRSWGLSKQFPQAPVSGLADHGLRSLGMSSPFLAEHAARLRNAAQANMQRLAERILAG